MSCLLFFADDLGVYDGAFIRAVNEGFKDSPQKGLLFDKCLAVMGPHSTYREKYSQVVASRGQVEQVFEVRIGPNEILTFRRTP